MIPVYDYDIDAKDQASVDSKARVKAGFDALVARLSTQLRQEKESAANRHLAALRRSNAFWDALRPPIPHEERPETPPVAPGKAPPREVT